MVKKMKKKQYIVVKPIMEIPSEEISINIVPGTADTQFCPDSKSLYIRDEDIIKWTGKGIIAEKKSANEKLAERICSEYWESTSDNYRSQRLYTVILEELEKAGVK